MRKTVVNNLFHPFRDGQDGFFHWGCHALLERLSQITPALHCFGHVHDEVGAKMLSFDGVEVGIWRLHMVAYPNENPYILFFHW